MARVAMVCMPFYKAEVPPISLGLLKSVLKAHEIDSDLWHLNMWFAEENFPSYQEINNESFFHGEWVFSHALWDEPAPQSADEVIEALKLTQARFCSEFVSEAEADPSFDLDAQRDAQEAVTSDPDDVLTWSDYGERVLYYVQAVEPFLERCLTEIDWSQYDLVGFTSTFQQNVASLALAKRLKAQYPDLYIMFGGGNCDGIMGRAMFEGFPFLDGVCTAEGDEVFPQFVSALLAGEPAQPITGILDRRCAPKPNPLQIVQDRTPPRPPFVNLNALPYPDYDSFFEAFEQSSFSDTDVLLYFETSRGCWYGQKQHCTFCGVNGSAMDFRTKDADRAVEEIKYLYDRYGGFTKLLGATDNIMPAQYPKTMLPKLAALNLDTEIFYETKSNLTQEQLQLYYESGVRQVQPGIESLNSQVLKLMKKGVSGIRNIQMLKWSIQYDVNPKWNILYGFPGETPADYEGVAEQFARLHHLPPPLSCVPIRIDRFSPYHERPEEYGITNLKAHPAYHEIYRGLDARLIEDLAYCFVGDWDSKHLVSQYDQEVWGAVARWQREHDQVALIAITSDDRVAIGDFRVIGSPSYWVLSGIERELYLTCERARALKFIAQRLTQSQGFEITADAVAELAAPLVERGVLLAEDDKLLSLAIPLESALPMGDGYFPPPVCWPYLGELLELMTQELPTSAAIPSAPHAAPHASPAAPSPV